MATAEAVRTPIAHAPATGDDLVEQFRQVFPRELAEVPMYCWDALVRVADEALLDARKKGNIPRHCIPEDAKRGGTTHPKR